MKMITNERKWRRIAQILLFARALLDLVVCPHSKVEESFQLQAVHDLFYDGLKPALLKADTLPYDHLQFPGVVPRTFCGPLILSTCCQVLRCILWPVFDIADHPMVVQFLARFFFMTTMVILGWFPMANALDRKTGQQTIGTYLLLITACQFHLPFYASRLLPNSFATVFCLMAFTKWIDGNVKMAARFLVFVCTVIRCDVILLLFTCGLSWLMTRQLTVLRAIWLGLVTGIMSLLLTVPLDSLLWQRLVWPEGEVLYFNTVLGKSSDWGVSAWHWYWTSALPKAMLLTVLTIPFAILRLPEKLVSWERRYRFDATLSVPISWFDEEWLPYLLPAAGFVALYSCLGHKEMRFLFPVMPLINLAAAVGMARVHSTAFPDKDKNAAVVSRLAHLGCVVALILSFVGSMLFVAVSRWNYPGGDALNALVQHVSSSNPKDKHVHVHVDVASAMTGVSLFEQRTAALSTPGIPWTFDKAGYEEQNAATSVWSTYTHILSEVKEIAIGFRQVDVIQGKPWLDFKHGRIMTTDTIYVMEREGWGL